MNKPRKNERQRPKRGKCDSHREQKRKILNSDFRQHVITLAAGEKPFLPVTDKDFQKCSSAINQLTHGHGQPLLLPSELLPPLF